MELTKKTAITAITGFLLSLALQAQGIDAKDLACAVVLCVYGEKFGDGEQDASCVDPLNKYFGIEKKTGKVVKKFSCPATKAARIAYMKTCTEHDDSAVSLSSIVTCDT